jgi:hypothetical protein
MQLQRRTQRHQQQAAVHQEKIGSQLFTGAAAGDLWPSSRPNCPALSFLDGMEAGMELECPMAELNVRLPLLCCAVLCCAALRCAVLRCGSGTACGYACRPALIVAQATRCAFGPV